MNFQTIAGYPEKTVEATLRKRIQNCHNANFIFSGSKRHMMALMFTSRSRPFYHSSSIMGLEAINEQTYLEFANHHLSKINKEISAEAFSYLYHRFDGITWYIQYVLNMLYTWISDSRVLGKRGCGILHREHSFAASLCLSGSAVPAYQQAEAGAHRHCQGGKSFLADVAGVPA